MQVLDGIQSALNPQGPHAEAVAEISWVLLVGSGVLFVGVLVFCAYAIFGARDRVGRMAPERIIVCGGLVLPLIVLGALLLYTLARSASLAEQAPESALRIRITGQQWWWRVAYLTSSGEVDIVTANELRLPVGHPVMLLLESSDVIHSFWAPALAGKMDMIPGRVNGLRVRADRAGRWRGQCAEYCGGPHGRMALQIVAQESHHFDAWLAQQRAPAQLPRSAAATAGERLFLEHCSACHSVRGTPARGALAPDLTHVASRATLGAGLLPNNPGALGAWITSSQHLKPGNLMPSFTRFSGVELRALVEYVAGLE